MRLLLLICLGLTAATCRAVSAPDAQGGTSTPTGAKPVGVCCDGVPSAAELNPGTVGIRRIAKVTLATPDLVASQKWWETAFGFTAQPKFKSKFGEVVCMTLFNGWLTIELVTAAEGTVLDPAAIIPDPYASNTKWSSVFTQFSFRVVNNTAALDLLRERGVESAVRGAPAVMPSPTVGLSLSFVRDPTTGALVQLLEPLDTSLITDGARVPDWIVHSSDSNPSVNNPLGILGFEQVSSSIKDVETSMSFGRHVLGLEVPHGYGYVDLRSYFGTIIALGRNPSHFHVEHIQNASSVPFADFSPIAHRYPNQARLAGIVSYAVTVTEEDLSVARDTLATQIESFNTAHKTSLPPPTAIYKTNDYGESFFITDVDGLLIEFQHRTRSPMVVFNDHAAGLVSRDVDTILRDYSGFPNGGETAVIELINTATKQGRTFTGRDGVREFWDSFLGTGYDPDLCDSTLPLIGGMRLEVDGFWIGWQCPQFGITVGSDSVKFDEDNLIRNHAINLHWPGMDIESWTRRDVNVTWAHHVNSLVSSDAKAASEDYAEDAVLETVNSASKTKRAYRGRDEIQKYWEGLFAVFDLTNCKQAPMTFTKRNTGVFAWSACQENGVVSLADTISLGDTGHIRHQSMVFHWPGMDMETLKPTHVEPSGSGSGSSGETGLGGAGIALIVLAPFTLFGLFSLAMLVHRKMKSGASTNEGGPYLQIGGV